MGWRTVLITSRAKLDYKLGRMYVRREDDVTKIHLSEISMVIVESTEVSVTTALLMELTKNKSNVIFCDEKRNPCAQLVGFYGCHDTSGKYRDQIAWNPDAKTDVWTVVVKEKISRQRDLLRKLGKSEEELLTRYVEQLRRGDASNREGHAAKVYFNALFGMDFSRAKEDPINAALNYGYALILSAINREIVKNGFMTQLGIHHDNVDNHFNLGCDLFEPLRPYVDAWVVANRPVKFSVDEKHALVDLVNGKVKIGGNEHYLLNALEIYVKSVFDALAAQDASKIKFCHYEF